MPQLHLYVPQDVADELRRRAEAEGMSTSKYLASLVESRVEPAWPANWFERVVGGWQGELERAPAGALEDRERW
jgi:hypothetical protein